MKRFDPQSLTWLNISIVLITASAIALMVVGVDSRSLIGVCATWFAAAGFLIVAIIRSGKTIAKSRRASGFTRLAGMSFGVIMLVATTVLEIGVCGLLILTFNAGMSY